MRGTHGRWGKIWQPQKRSKNSTGATLEPPIRLYSWPFTHWSIILQGCSTVEGGDVKGQLTLKNSKSFLIISRAPDMLVWTLDTYSNKDISLEGHFSCQTIQYPSQNAGQTDPNVLTICEWVNVCVWDLQISKVAVLFRLRLYVKAFCFQSEDKQRTSRHMIIELRNIHARVQYLYGTVWKGDQMRKSPWGMEIRQGYM